MNKAMPDASEIEKNEEIEHRVKCKLETYINGEDNGKSSDVGL